MKKYQLKILIPVAYCIASLTLFYVVVRSGVTAVQIVGIVLAVTAFALWITARVQLANNFSIGAHANELVTTGLYARFRHPVYYFSILALIGITLAVANYYLFGAVAVLIILEMSRIRAEERKLHDAFGKRYEVYKKNTWF